MILNRRIITLLILVLLTATHAWSFLLPSEKNASGDFFENTTVCVEENVAQTLDVCRENELSFGYDVPGDCHATNRVGGRLGTSFRDFRRSNIGQKIGRFADNSLSALGVRNIDDAVSLNQVTGSGLARARPGAVRLPSRGKALERGNTKISPSIQRKILTGDRPNPSANRIRGGHSGRLIGSSGPKLETDILKVNPDGTLDVKFIVAFPSGGVSRIKKSTLFPRNWSDSKILDAALRVGEAPPVFRRASDGATLHRMTIGNVQIEVVKVGDRVTSAYPTGGRPSKSF